MKNIALWTGVSCALTACLGVITWHLSFYQQLYWHFMLCVGASTTEFWSGIHILGRAPLLAGGWPILPQYVLLNPGFWIGACVGISHPARTDAHLLFRAPFAFMMSVAIRILSTTLYLTPALSGLHVTKFSDVPVTSAIEVIVAVASGFVPYGLGTAWIVRVPLGSIRSRNGLI